MNYSNDYDQFSEDLQLFIDQLVWSLASFSLDAYGLCVFDRKGLHDHANMLLMGAEMG